ncbi:MAG: rhodanese-like domain-containing protein [Phycisphaeraceae bacterium]
MMHDSATMNDKPIDLSPAQVRAQTERDDTVLIDVREPFEHHAERIEGGVPMPLGSLDVDALRERYPGKRIIFHCAAGGRSAKACKQFALGQAEPTHHLAGGIEAWKLAGLPTLKPAKAGPIPVMRQVQITAGSLVVIGLMLGYFVATPFLLLSAFVGSGLVFAGISGWCGMAKLLAKMPWNRTA